MQKNHYFNITIHMEDVGKSSLANDASVTNRHPEMPLFPKTATQKDKKNHPSFSPRCFLSLNKRFSKAAKIVYLFNKRAS